MKNETIHAPASGSVVHHTGWRFEDNPNYPCDVYVNNGQYEVNGRLSNWWTWQRVLEDGSLADPESGYGSQEKRREITSQIFNKQLFKKYEKAKSLSSRRYAF